VRRLRPALTLVLFGAASVFGACNENDGNGAGTGEPLVGTGPEPTSMCEGGGVPLIAAYDADSGAHRWTACDDVLGYVALDAATVDRVFVRAGRVVLGLDAETGAEVWRGSEVDYEQQLPRDADRITREPPVLDDVLLTGGQQDPLVAIDPGSGKERWSQPAARLAYDDVWAVGDNAVFAVERLEGGLDVVAYEISTGEVRWRRQLEGYLWPWHVRGDRLLVLWHNIEVVDTGDGRVIWKTDFAVPQSGFPRMNGAVANDDLVFVSFTVVASGGD
jgi:outer membrane protein assembly factor BamB